MKTITGTLWRLEFGYFNVAHYFFDEGNWCWRFFALIHIASSLPNVMTL